MSRPKARVSRAARGGRVAWPPQKRQTARAAIEALMRERGLARRFDKAVEREANRAREQGVDAHADLASRRDLRALPTFTIDPASARDFDDAISAERLPDGAVRVWVHIADVSAYVPVGSLVDREAQLRSTSVYVPGAVEPMLPRALSNALCSLLPGSERLAVTVEMDLHGADVTRTAFLRTLIRSDARLDYEQVDRVFAGVERAQDPWAQPLQAARAAAAALGQARAGRGGALTLDQPEPEFVFDAHGEVSEIRARTQTESHRLIEQLMIAANEAVARHLAERKAPCLYRVHERPRIEKAQRLVEQLVSLGVPTPPLPSGSSERRTAELIAEISRRVERHVTAVAARARAGDRSAAPSGGRLALTSLVLRSLQQAYYSPRNVGHAGLGSACYCHFTSPIRRYPDLVCHRALLASIGMEARAPRAAGLEKLGEWTSEREREAMRIERDADDVARCFALERVLLGGGWEQRFRGEVTGLISAGAFIAFGPESGGEQAPGAESHGEQASGAGSRGELASGMPPYEGMLPVRHMSAPGERDWWDLNEQATILHGERTGETIRLGDRIEVQVGRVESARGRVDLARPDTVATDAAAQPRGGTAHPNSKRAGSAKRKGAARPSGARTRKH